MKLITRDTDYAIRALCFIAKSPKELITVNELAADLKIPKPFLRKILQTLNRRKVLKSYKGRAGGFILSFAPKEIFISDIIRIFQGPVKLNEHIFKKGICPHIKTCVLKKRLDAIERYVIAKLEAITVASLIRDVGKER